MTALTEYQRLETSGIWRGAPDEQRRDVTVSLGNATLVIYDSAGRALAHWSLPALERLNPGQEPAIYAPGPSAPEELEIEETEMVGAIERIRTAIEKRRPHKGRLRFFLMAAALTGVIAGGVYWVPDALIRHAAAVVPPVKRAELGQRLLAHVERLSGQPCETVAGTAALTRLYTRLVPNGAGRLVVLSSGAVVTGHLPGDVILLSRRLVEDHDTPDVVAGYILAERLRMESGDTIETFLAASGPFTAARLLTTGDVPENVLAEYAEDYLTQAPALIDQETLLVAFKDSRVSSEPYAYARDITGERTLTLIEANPGSTAAVLPDSAWIGLQAICE